MKCRKIQNVDKSVCVAEQQIAYNFAFRYSDLGKKVLQADTAEINKADGFFQIENLVLEEIKSNEAIKRYNIDAIIVAFRNGFRKFCEKPFIAHNYEVVGECFAIPYDIE